MGLEEIFPRLMSVDEARTELEMRIHEKQKTKEK